MSIQLLPYHSSTSFLHFQSVYNWTKTSDDTVVLLRIQCHQVITIKTLSILESQERQAKSSSVTHANPEKNVIPPTLQTIQTIHKVHFALHHILILVYQLDHMSSYNWHQQSYISYYHIHNPNCDRKEWKGTTVSIDLKTLINKHLHSCSCSRLLYHGVFPQHVMIVPVTCV